MTGDRTPRKPMAGWSRAAQVHISGTSAPYDPAALAEALDGQSRYIGDLTTALARIAVSDDSPEERRRQVQAFADDLAPTRLTSTAVDTTPGVAYALGASPCSAVLTFSLEDRQDSPADDPVSTTLRFVSEMRIGPARRDDLLSADDVGEFSVHDANLVGRLQSVPTSFAAVDDACHGGQRTSSPRTYTEPIPSVAWRHAPCWC